MKPSSSPHPATATPETLAHEAQRATALLRGKSVKPVWRHRPGEVGIEFADRTRLFVETQSAGLELGITSGAGSEPAVFRKG